MINTCDKEHIFLIGRDQKKPLTPGKLVKHAFDIHSHGIIIGIINDQITVFWSSLETNPFRTFVMPAFKKQIVSKLITNQLNVFWGHFLP